MGKFNMKIKQTNKKHTNTILSIRGEIIAIVTQAMEGANTINAMAISAQLTI